MDFDKFTERARGFIESAQGLALRSNHQQLSPEHILKVLLDDEEGMASNLIQAAGGEALFAGFITGLPGDLDGLVAGLGEILVECPFFQQVLEARLLAVLPVSILDVNAHDGGDDPVQRLRLDEHPDVIRLNFRRLSRREERSGQQERVHETAPREAEKAVLT